MDNQKGFTLIELTIATGLVGVLSLGALKLYEDSSSHLSKITSRSGAEDVVSNMERVLSNPSYCKNALGGVSVSSTATSLGTNGSLDSTIMSYTHPINGVTKLIGEDQYTKYEIPDGGIKIKESEFSTSIAELSINFKLKGSLTGVKDIQKIIYLSLVRSGSTISSCSSIVSSVDVDLKRSLCLRIGNPATGWGGIWDSGTSTCTFKGYSCPVGQLVSGISNFGTVNCASVSSRIQASLGDYFDVVTVRNCTGKSSFRLDGTSGKYSLICE